MASIEDYKIKVISGINDVPLEPNYSGNGKGCNGAFYTERHNKLTDLVFALQANLGTNLIKFLMNYNLSDDRFLLEIGTEFLLENESLEIAYEIEETLDTNIYIPTARVYFGTNSKNLSPVSEIIGLNDIWEFYATPYSIIPNVENVNKTYYFQIQGSINDLLDFKTQYKTLKWIPKAIFGYSSEDNILDPYDIDLTPIKSSLTVPESIYKPVTNEAKFIYFFIPKNISEFPSEFYIKSKENNFPITLIKLATDIQLTITSDGNGNYNHLYDIYRTVYSTVGEIEIIFVY